MERKKSHLILDKLKRKLPIYIPIIFLIGALGHIIPRSHQLFLGLTPVMLILINTIVLLLFFQSSNNQSKFIIWSLLSFLATFSLEVIGVKTGLIFGGYQYGTTLGAQIFQVPPIIGYNWILIILSTSLIVESVLRQAGFFIKSEKNFIKISLKIILKSVFSALMCVGFDFIMEEVAINLDYWQWEGGKIPLQNYLAWFIISFVFSSILYIFEIKFKNKKIAFSYFFSQLLFFAILRIFL
jgi:putative membrane protein